MALSLKPSSSKQAFGRRLSKVMVDAGHVATRGAASGVDVRPLATKLGVSREMARRYLAGKALPDPDKLDRIGVWLGIRVAYLRDGEGDPQHHAPSAAQPAPAYMLGDDAIEIAQAWSTLSDERRLHHRNSIFLEAAVAKLVPWLRIPQQGNERYREFELRIQEDFARLAKQLTLNL